MNTMALLDQTEVWFDRDEQPHELIDMSPRYKANVINFLVRRARLMEFNYSLREALWLTHMEPMMGEMAFDSVENAIFADQDKRFKNPAAWLWSTPLLRELEWQVAAGVGGEDD